MLWYFLITLTFKIVNPDANKTIATFSTFCFTATPYWDDPDETYGTSDLYGESAPSRDMGQTSEGLILPYNSQHEGPQEFFSPEEEWACGEGLVWRDGQCQGIFFIFFFCHLKINFTALKLL